MLVNVLLVHHDGRVKMNDITLHSRNQIATIEISTSSEFVYTEAIECKKNNLHILNIAHLKLFIFDSTISDS
jgi:hypothetical protein